MAVTGLRCSAGDCTDDATETLYFEGQPGHTHDCPPHAALVREWCDVVKSTPIVDGVCADPTCTGNTPVWTGKPTPLGDL